MRFLAALAMMLAVTVSHAAQAPYVSQYPVPEEASGWDAGNICEHYGIATTMLMSMKRDGKPRGEASDETFGTISASLGEDRASSIKEAFDEIVDTVYTTQLPAVEAYEVEREIKGRCLRSNGFQ